jgi:hypothetical protein
VHAVLARAARARFPKVIVRSERRRWKACSARGAVITRCAGMEALSHDPRDAHAFIRRTSCGQPEAKREVWADLQAVLKHLGRTPPHGGAADSPLPITGARAGLRSLRSEARRRSNCRVDRADLPIRASPFAYFSGSDRRLFAAAIRRWSSLPRTMVTGALRVVGGWGLGRWGVVGGRLARCAKRPLLPEQRASSRNSR